MYGVRFLGIWHPDAVMEHTPVPIEIAPKDTIPRAGRCLHATRTS